MVIGGIRKDHIELGGTLLHILEGVSLDSIDLFRLQLRDRLLDEGVEVALLGDGGVQVLPVLRHLQRGLVVKEGQRQIHLHIAVDQQHFFLLLCQRGLRIRRSFHFRLPT